MPVAPVKSCPPVAVAPVLTMSLFTLLALGTERAVDLELYLLHHPEHRADCEPVLAAWNVGHTTALRAYMGLFAAALPATHAEALIEVLPTTLHREDRDGLA